MSQIFIPSQTQRIIVDPATSAARVVLAGPVGPRGEPGISGGGTIPEGGTSGDALVKISNTDYDVGWSSVITGAINIIASEAAFPTSGTYVGETLFYTVNSTIYIWNGATWVPSMDVQISSTTPTIARSRLWVNPSNSTLYFNVNGVWTSIAGGGGSSDVTVSDTAPEPPLNNFWIDSANLSLYFNLDGTWVELSQVGPQGLSAYQVAVENGFVGTEESWLLSLKGATGSTFVVTSIVDPAIYAAYEPGPHELVVLYAEA